jgi:hypothetical protein
MGKGGAPTQPGAHWQRRGQHRSRNHLFNGGMKALATSRDATHTMDLLSDMTPKTIGRMKPNALPKHSINPMVPAGLFGCLRVRWIAQSPADADTELTSLKVSPLSAAVVTPAQKATASQPHSERTNRFQRTRSNREGKDSGACEHRKRCDSKHQETCAEDPDTKAICQRSKYCKRNGRGSSIAKQDVACLRRGRPKVADKELREEDQQAKVRPRVAGVRATR